MTSIAIKDLKRPRELRSLLDREGEVFVTKDGRPFAIMVGVDEDGAENALREVRRAMFSAAVSRVRERQAPISEEDITREISAVRKQRVS